jgi:hypothetical protein
VPAELLPQVFSRLWRGGDAPLRCAARRTVATPIESKTVSPRGRGEAPDPDFAPDVAPENLGLLPNFGAAGQIYLLSDRRNADKDFTALRPSSIG